MAKEDKKTKEKSMKAANGLEDMLVVFSTLSTDLRDFAASLKNQEENSFVNMLADQADYVKIKFTAFAKAAGYIESTESM